MRKFNCLAYSVVAISVMSATFTISRTFAQEIPKAECISNNFGNIKCGYNCVKNNFGDIRCSDWPGGACKANNFGDIVCGPPAPPGWSSRYIPNSNSTNAGINGAWAVKVGKWNGIRPLA